MRTLSIIALVLLIIGGLNWGVIGLTGFDMVAALFGVGTALTSIINILVGLSGIFGIFMLVELARSREDVCVPGHTGPYTPQAQ